MKRLFVLTIILVLFVLLQPNSIQGKMMEPSVSIHCPTGFWVVGNSEVDMNYGYNSCSGELYWTRDGVEIAGSRGQTFYRDATLNKGDSHGYQYCCDTGTGTDTCSGTATRTAGDITGWLCQDLEWSGGEYGTEGYLSSLNIAENATLKITGATLRTFALSNSTSDVLPYEAGDVQIEGATLENVKFYIGSPGNNYIKNSVISDSSAYNATGYPIIVKKKAEVFISGNTFYSTTIDIYSGYGSILTGPRATISNNAFHRSDIEVRDALSVTTEIVGNWFYFTERQSSSSLITLEKSQTVIANNNFIRSGTENTSAKAIEIRYSDDPLHPTTSTIENNIIRGFNQSNDKGIYIYGANVSATISDNSITTNDTGIYINTSDASVSAQQNCIAGNNIGLSGLYASVDARYNWWGDASGPDAYGNSSGTGDRISGRDGLYDPWLTTDNCLTEPAATLTLSVPQYRLPADGLTVVEIQAELTNQGGPVVGAVVEFDHTPATGIFKRSGILWPTSAKTDAQGQVKVLYQVPRIPNLPSDPEVTISARSGNSMDEDVLTFRGDVPKITGVEVVGLGTLDNLPEIGNRVAVIVSYNTASFYEVFTLNVFTEYGIEPIHQSVSDNQITVVFIPPTGLGTYGKKTISFALGYRSKSTGIEYYHLLQNYPVTFYFARDGDDDGNGAPNWFDYWSRDGAAADLSNIIDKEVIYNPTLGMSTAGVYVPSAGKLLIGPRAALDSPAINIAAGPGCPGYSVIGTQGVDTFDATVNHELKRKVYTFFWKKDGNWHGKVDSDDLTPDNKLDDLLPADNIPDETELYFGTDKDNVDSCNLGAIRSSYSLNGDHEVWLSEQKLDLKGDNSKDWANPGSQTGGLSMAGLPIPFVDQLPESSNGPETKLLLNSVHDITSNPYGFASLTGIYADTAYDLDSDSLYDELEISVGVDVDQEETYNVVAWLENASGTPIGWAATQSLLTPGPHTIDLFFDGQIISEAGLDGPYTVKQVELRLGPRELLMEAPSNVHTTAPYNAGDFDPPDVAFTGTFTDEGVDTGSDSLYDFLNIDIGLKVANSGHYTVTGELSGTHTIAITQTTANLAVGTYTVTLAFDGESIYRFRQDGPYDLQALRVVDSSGKQVDFLYQATTTGNYAFVDFQHMSTTLDADSYTDMGVDYDGNGKYESLLFSLDVDIDVAETYVVVATLADQEGTPIHAVGRQLDLDVGTQAIELEFYGQAIASHGSDGPYVISSISLLRLDGTLVDYHPHAHTTQVYSWTDFEYEGLVYIPILLR